MSQYGSYPNPVSEAFKTAGSCAHQAGIALRNMFLLMDQLRKHRLPRKAKKKLKATFGNRWTEFIK